MDKYDRKQFIDVKWKDVYAGQTVYLAGTHLGDFLAYGPHIVVDPVKMVLKNRNQECFLQYQEILCYHINDEF